MCVAALLSGNVVDLRRARLVLGLGWVTVRGYTILVFNQKPPRPTQSPWVGNEYWWWSRSPLGKKRRVLRNSGHVPGLLAYWHDSWLKALVVGHPADMCRIVC